MVLNIYFRLKSYIMRNIIAFVITSFVLIPFFSFAQQPKMNLKLIGGINTNSFIYKVEGISSEMFLGWQAGAGTRIMYRHVFGEFDILFKEFGTEYIPFQDIDSSFNDVLNLQMNALEFPITAGYIPVKTPFFKLFVYGGFVNKFSLKGKIKYLGEEFKYKPDELNLHFYNLSARFGTQFDIAMFNFDVCYDIGITNGIKGKARTNTNGFHFSAAVLF